MVGRLSYDQVVVSSSPSQGAAAQQLRASCSHPCAPVTKQKPERILAHHVMH